MGENDGGNSGGGAGSMTVQKWRKTTSKSQTSRKMPKSLTKIKKKRKPTGKRGAKSGFGRDPGWTETVSSQQSIMTYFSKEARGISHGNKEELNDTNLF